MDCFARNSALRAALDPATDNLLFDIVINPCGARAHRRPRTYCAPAHRHLSLLPAGMLMGSPPMLLYVLRMGGVKKSKNINEINDVTLLQMES